MSEELSLEEKEERKRLSKEERQAKALARQKEREKNKGVQDPSKFYCTNKELLEELTKWRSELDKAIDDAVNKCLEVNPAATSEQIKAIQDNVMKDPMIARPSEKLGSMLLHIATKLTNHSRFRNYSYDVKQEMISYASFKMIQGMINFSPKFKNPFAYFTQAAYNAFLNVLAKYYRQINLKKELIRQNLSQLECTGGINSSKIINSFLKDYLGLSDEEMGE